MKYINSTAKPDIFGRVSTIASLLHGRSQMRRGVMEAPSRFRSNLTEAMIMFKVDDDADVEQPEPVCPRVQHRNR